MLLVFIAGLLTNQTISDTRRCLGDRVAMAELATVTFDERDPLDVAVQRCREHDEVIVVPTGGTSAQQARLVLAVADLLHVEIIAVEADGIEVVRPAVHGTDKIVACQTHFEQVRDSLTQALIQALPHESLGKIGEPGTYIARVHDRRSGDVHKIDQDHAVYTKDGCVVELREGMDGCCLFINIERTRA